MLLEVLVDVSAPLVLKIRCFSTSRTASGFFRPYRTTSECFNISDIKTDVSIPLDAQGFISVPLEQQMNVSAHNATYH